MNSGSSGCIIARCKARLRLYGLTEGRDEILEAVASLACLEDRFVAQHAIDAMRVIHEM